MNTKLSPHTFIYADALCGSGKTYQLVNSTIPYFKKNKIKSIIASPTIELSKQTQQCFYDANNHIKTKRIDSSTCITQVSPYLDLEFESKEHDVVLITHASLPYFVKSKSKNDLSSYALHIDEEFSIFKIIDLALKSNRNWLDNKINLVDYNDDYYEVTHTDEMKKYHSDYKQDQIKRATSDLYNHLKDESRKVLLNKEDYDNFKNRKITQISFISIFDFGIFDLFHSVTFHSAFAKQTFTALFASIFGFKLVSQEDIYPDIKNTKRYTEHKNTNNTFIHYYRVKRASKHYYDSCITYNGLPVFDNTFSDFMRQTSGKEKIVSANKETNLVLEQKNLPDVHVISSKSHGLNQYQHIDNVYTSFSLRITNVLEEFLLSVGISEEEYDFAFGVLPTYQTIMRSSARDPNNNNRRDFFVPDQYTANELSIILNIPSERIIDESSKSLELVKNPEYIFEDQDRKKKLQSVKHVFKRECDNLKILREEGLGFACSILDSMRTTKVVTDIKFDSCEEIINFFEQENNYFSDKKDAKNRLLFPVVFDEEISGVSTSYGNDNVYAVSFLMFDYDGSDYKKLTMNKASEILKEININHFIYETFSGNGNFRIVIPLEYIVTPIIASSMLSMINNYFYKKGYTHKENSYGPFDNSKFNASSKFFLPNHKTGSNPVFIKVTDEKYLNPKEFFNNRKFSVPNSIINKVLDKEIVLKKNDAISLSRLSAKTTDEAETDIENFKQNQITKAKNNFHSKPSNESCLKLIRQMYYYGCNISHTISYIKNNYNPTKSDTDYTSTIRTWYSKRKSTFNSKNLSKDNLYFKIKSNCFSL